MGWGGVRVGGGGVGPGEGWRGWGGVRGVVAMENDVSCLVCFSG